MTELQNSQSKRKRALSYFGISIFVIAVLATLYWFFFVRNYESTEDAYVAGNQVMISSQVNGNIAQINVEDMSFVHAGDLLITLDDTDAKLAFEQAQSNLANAVRQVSQLHFNQKQLSAVITAKQRNVEKAKGDLSRRENLTRSGSIDKETLEHSKLAVDIAQAELDVALNQLKANQSLLLDMPLKQQPEVQKAVSLLKQAWLNLQRTKIVSPIDGYVTRRNAQLGQKVTVGAPLMAIIATDNLWLEANFKETQLTKMRIGQPVTIKFDLYGDNVQFNGKVEAIDLGTGSAFSLLPAQNATGNWIKVVQRVPVRISLEPEQLKKYPLRIGLSAHAKVDLSNQDGAVLKTQTSALTQQTNVLQYDLQPIEQLIENIVQQNTTNQP